MYRRYKSERFNACPILKIKRERASFSVVRKTLFAEQDLAVARKNARVACRFTAEVDYTRCEITRVKYGRIIDTFNEKTAKIKSARSTRADFLCETKSGEGVTVGLLKFALFINGGERASISSASPVSIV